MNTINKIDLIHPVVADKIFIETQYAKATNALRILIGKEGCCNAMKPYIDAINDIEPQDQLHEENKEFVAAVFDIFSAVIDIDLNKSMLCNRFDRINSAIKLLENLGKEYES